MNQKAYSILFVALLASTFVHELRAKGLGNQPKPVHSRHSLGVFERTSSENNQSCKIECSNSTSNGSGLTIQVIKDILVIINVTANAGFLLDVGAGIVAVLNGTTGGGVIINITSQTGVYFTSGLWSATNGMSAFFGILGSSGLSVLLTLSGGVAFSVAIASTAILQAVNNVIVHLVWGIQMHLLLNLRQGLDLVITVATQIIALLKGKLQGLLGLLGTLIHIIVMDLVGIVNLLIGLNTVIVITFGNLKTAIEKVNLDLVAILSAPNGFVALINLLLQICLEIDVGVALGGILNNITHVFLLTSQFGGHSLMGNIINGHLHFMASLCSLIDGQISLEVFISILIQFVAHINVKGSSGASTELNNTLSIVLQAVSHLNLNNTSSLTGFVNIINSLISGTCVYGGVNISLIISKLLSGVTSGLQKIVDVILVLQVIVAVSILIPSVALVLILKLASGIGIAQLINLGLLVTTLANILSGLLTGLVNIVSIVLQLLLGNFYDVLIKISYIGPIIIALNSAINVVAGNTINLRTLLNSSTLYQNLIKGCIQISSGISLGVSSTIITQVNSLLQLTGSLSLSIGLNLTASSSVSIGR